MTRQLGAAPALVCVWLTLAGPTWVADGSTASTVSGWVRDTNGPVAGAVVRVQATDNQTLTASEGAFVLQGLQGTSPLTITAWAPGYLIGWTEASPGAKDLTIRLRPHYTTDNEEYDWFSIEGGRGSQTCGHCMPGTHREWRADAHSQSAINPRFLTVYQGTDTEGNRSPDRRYTSDPDYGPVPVPPAKDEPYYGPGYRIDFPDTPGICAACHVPAAAAGRKGAYGADAGDLIGIETEGIFCELCHKIGGVKLEPSTGLPALNMPGVLSTRLYRPHEGQELFFGTLDDVTRKATKLPLQQESAFCAPCHHAVFWDTVVYNSYGEWLRSPYADPQTGQTCQACHMPRTRRRYIALPQVGGVKRRPGTSASHRMPGASDAGFLRRAVRLEVQAERLADCVCVEVRVTNAKAGHHIPTGHPSRNMLLVLSARDAEGGELELVSGRRLPEWAGLGDAADDYAGRPGKGYARILAEAWTGVWPTIAYWNPTTVREDTRIPACATDITRYEFRAAPDQGPIAVRAQLVFRRAFRELARQKKWNDPDIIIARRRVIVR